MSANGDGTYCDGTQMEKSKNDHDDDSVIKAENCGWEEMRRDHEIEADLTLNNRTIEDENGGTESQGQRDKRDKGDNRDSSSPAADQLGHTHSFECQQCNSQLDSFEQFIKHMRTAHLQHCDGSSVKCQCQICGRQFASNRMEFNAHLAEHLLDTRTKWHCLRCHGTQFDEADELRRHFSQSHVHTVFRCTICFELFTERDDLQDHLMANHCAKQQKFFCAACEIPFDSRFAFELHIGQVHAVIGGEQSKSWHGQSKMMKKEQQKRSGNNTSGNGTMPKNAKCVQFAFLTHPPQRQQKGLKCVVCDTQCPDELSLDRHRLFEHCKVPYGNRCGLCRCPLESIAAFVEHSLAHRNPVNEELHCVVCRQLIRGDIQLKMHGQYHLEGAKGEEKEMEEEDKQEEDDEKEKKEDEKGESDVRGDGRAENALHGKAGDDAEPTRHNPLPLAPTNSTSSACASVTASADNDDCVGTQSVRMALPTINCPSCKMNVMAEDYGKHLLFHVMVGSLTEFAVGTFGDNGCGDGENAQKGDQSLAEITMGCAQCSRTFDTFVGLNSHMSEHLRENIGGNAPKPKTADKGRLRDRSDPSLTACQREQSIGCDKCGQTFVSIGRFVAHRRRHKMERTLAKCRICDRRFGSKTQLDEHHSSEHSAKLHQLMGK
ncbi:hypothetical protein niasHS_013571 [Heterodera schachtii]|uniref:C2H2-type domain-containing protein n=1 Tax=Heterodera schachtii TaxID=97005 RepID=A0ABD2IFI7_HETSC